MSPYVAAYLGPRYRPDAPAPVLPQSQAEVRRRLLAEDRPGDWESPACVCGATAGRILSAVDRYGLPYRKVLCTRCGLLRVTPRWVAERYARFYEESYRDLYSPLAANSSAATLRELAQGPGAVLVAEFVQRAWRRFGNPQLPRPVIVEIGAGGGWNLSRLPDSWIRIGYDTDERFLTAGRDAFGIELRTGFFAEALGAAAEADCILLSHVLEHVPDPVAALQDLRRCARPDTLILIEVPGIFRLHKTSLDPMRYWQNAHTFTFCAQTIVDVCRRAGYEPLSVDEWIRLVLSGASAAAAPAVSAAPDLAHSIERYLRYCERSHRIVQRCAKMPLVGGPAAWMVRRGADALMRAAGALGLIAGMRAATGISKSDIEETTLGAA